MMIIDDIVGLKMVEDEPWSDAHSWCVASYDPGSDMVVSYLQTSWFQTAAVQYGNQKSLLYRSLTGL